MFETSITEVLNSVQNGKKTWHCDEDLIINMVFRDDEQIAYKEDVSKKEAFFGLEKLTANDGVICDSNVVTALDENWQSYVTLEEGE